MPSSWRWSECHQASLEIARAACPPCERALSRAKPHAHVKVGHRKQRAILVWRRGEEGAGALLDGGRGHVEARLVKLRPQLLLGDARDVLVQRRKWLNSITVGRRDVRRGSNFTTLRPELDTERPSSP